MTPYGAGAHPDVELLAQVDDGLLGDAAEEAAVRAHVAGCPACREDLAALDRARQALAGLAAPPLPAAVAARLDEALAREAASERPGKAAATVDDRESGTVRTLRPSTSRWRTPALAAAALVVVAAAGLGAARIFDSGHHSGNDTSAARPVSTPSPTAGHQLAPELSQGPGAKPQTRAQGSQSDGGSGAVHQYTRTALGQQAAALVAGRTTAGSGPVPPEVSRLTAADQLTACVAEVTHGSGAAPRAVDYGTLDGTPAAILVLPGAGDTYDVWAVGGACGPGHADMLAHAATPR
ncbi:MAG: zf-HC2 domain-containing protein [Mycobacteriales bacterium]